MIFHPPKEKGFVIATDAFFALIILFALITLSFDALKLDGRQIGERQSLILFAEYSGRSLEQSGLLARAVVLNSTSELRTFLNGWPQSKCGTISLFPNPDENEAVLVITKAGCTYSSGSAEIIRRGFIVPLPPDANLYVASISVWVNQG